MLVHNAANEFQNAHSYLLSCAATRQLMGGLSRHIHEATRNITAGAHNDVYALVKREMDAIFQFVRDDIVYSRENIMQLMGALNATWSGVANDVSHLMDCGTTCAVCQGALPQNGVFWSPCGHVAHSECAQTIWNHGCNSCHRLEIDLARTQARQIPAYMLRPPRVYRRAPERQQQQQVVHEHPRGHDRRGGNPQQQRR